MSSLFQETIRPFVRKQLKIREAILKQGNDGKSRFTSNTVDLSKEGGNKKTKLPAGAFYTYTTSRQCVIRMCSGVDLLPDTEIPEKGKYEGNGVLEGENMALRYILEGGIQAKNTDFGGLEGAAKRDGQIKQNPRGGFPGNKKEYGLQYGDPYIRSDAKDNYGIGPMPGIMDAQIRTASAYGSLRTAKVNFKCHNRRQLEILELLYMRPGYPILLEWGWSTYITDDVGTIKRQQEFPFIKEFFEGNSTQEFINSIILENKVKTGGNYDGFLGVCKNYEIIARTDGGFDCYTEIMAMGEILEGLKGTNSNNNYINTDSGLVSVTNLEYYLYVIKEFLASSAGAESLLKGQSIYQGGDRRTEDFLISESRLKGEVNSNFYETFNNIVKLANGGKGLKKQSPSSTPEVTQEDVFEANFDPGYGDLVTPIDNTNVFINDVTNPGKNANTSAASQYEYDLPYSEALQEVESIIDRFFLYKGENLSVDGEKGINGTKAAYSYIRWDLFVEILNTFIIDKIKDDKDKPESLIKITYLENPLGKSKPQYSTYSTFQFKNMTNKVLFQGGLENGLSDTELNLEEVMDMSINPSICLLPHQLKNFTKDKDGIVLSGTEAPLRSIGKIFFNIEYLYNLYKKLEGENFNLFNYINNIWQDVNKACGGTKDFQILTELERPNVIKISDLIIQNNQFKPEDLYEFKIQGNESIVRDFNFNTTIPSAIAATVAVTAQARSIESLDNVSFAAFNKNIKSRFSKNIEIETDFVQLAGKYNKDTQSLIQMIIDLHKYRKEMLNGDFIKPDEDGKGTHSILQTSRARHILKNVEKLVRSLLSRYSDNQLGEDGEILHYKGSFIKNLISPSKSSIIPLKFNAVMDGIGGIGIGNVFRIDNTRLPLGYQGKDIAFITFHENQTITPGQDWTTTFSGNLFTLDLEKTQDEQLLFFKVDLTPEELLTEKELNEIDDFSARVDNVATPSLIREDLPQNES